MTTPNVARLDPSLLPTFMAVLDAGRISAAAKVLHLSQPAVTAQIRRLEESLGVALFVRSAQGVVPTAAGDRLAVHARAIAREIEDAVASVAVQDEPIGELVLAASTTIAAYVLPSMLAAFRASHPGVIVRLRVGNTEEVLGAVRGARVPLGLVEGHPRAAAGIRLESFVDDEIVAVIGASARFRVRSFADLAAVPILWREPGSGTRAVLERALRKRGIRRKPLAIDVELGSTEAILNAAASGLGLAFASRWSLASHLAAGRLLIVPGLDVSIRRTFRWALPSGGLRGTAGRFHAFAQRHPPVMA